MARSRMILLSLVALVVSLGAAFLARGLASPRVKPAAAAVVAAPKPVTQVLVAAHDLAVGDRLDAAAYTWRSWPAESVTPDFITDGGAAPPPVAPAAKLASVATSAADALAGPATGPATVFNGSVVREPIHSGEPILRAKIVQSGQGGVLAVTLTPGMRAMSVPISTENAAGGFIQPGDHVDMVGARKVEPANENSLIVTSTVMRNVRVIAIDQATRSDGKAAATAGAATATLEVTQAQAEAIVLAKTQAKGPLTLVLRSYADAAGPPTEGSVAMETAVVHVFRNGSATDVKVAR